jgi:uncharacterized protein (UPF0248 family)
LIPIHQLLSRVRWDREFGRGHFAIGYYDRVGNEIVRIPLSEIIFSRDDRDSIGVMDHDGIIRSVPLHRIREVYRNSELIWHRARKAQEEFK